MDNLLEKKIAKIVKETVKKLNEEYPTPSHTQSLNHENPTNVTKLTEDIIKISQQGRMYLEEGKITTVDGMLITIREKAIQLYQELGGEGTFY